MELKNIQKKANHYYSSLTRPLADEKGLVETAFVTGYAEATIDADKEIKSLIKILQKVHSEFHLGGVTWDTIDTIYNRLSR